MPNKKNPPLNPAQRRRKRDQQRREQQQAQKKREHQQEKRQEQRQEHKTKVNELGLLRPDQRQARIQRLLEGKENKKQDKRIDTLRESADTLNARRVRAFMSLTPEQRAKRIAAIEGNRKLSDAQQAARTARLEASGRVARFDPNGPHRPPGGQPPPVPGLPPSSGDQYLDLLSGAEKNAYQLIMLQFQQMGLGSGLGKEVYNAVVNGVTNVDMILQMVRQSDAYKARFPGMAKRDPNLPPLSEAEYIDLERQYRSIMQTAGLPEGFYDQPSDFASFIGDDKSPVEIQGRVDIAKNVAQAVDPYQRKLLANYYGIGQGELTAYFLDGARALPVLQRQVQSSGVAVFAHNLGVDQGRGIDEFGKLVDLGVSPEEAKARYGDIAMEYQGVNKFDYLYGGDYDISDAEKAQFFGDTRQRDRLIQNERATFSGSTKVSTSTGTKKFAY